MDKTRISADAPYCRWPEHVMRTLSVFSVLSLMSCTSTVNAPTAQLAVARSTIAEAERGGALEFAPHELNEARSKLIEADQAVRAGDNKKATRRATEAEVEARLARVTAEAGQAAKAADAVRQSNRALQQELNRPTDR